MTEQKQRIIRISEADDEAVGFYRKLGYTITSLGEKYPGVIRWQCIRKGEAFET